MCLRLARGWAPPLIREAMTSMRYQELRRRCQDRVRRLDEEAGIPRPFELRVFLDRLAEHRGRPILLHPSEHVAGRACGLWLDLGDADVIAHARTTPLHVWHIVLHEVGHMISAHRGGQLLDRDFLRRLAPDVDPAVAVRMMGRTSYSELEEQEAEMIASLILERARHRSGETVDDPGSPQAAQIADRFRDVFGG
ncbi:hypothetical protein FHR81_000544 [Actinoalloteichus hoggarensis]|uniref:hypothetical protein n=1 Tax=Actinoalloteichus hoggarensis TaxID=1470176 RepID=UPI000B8ABF94|nr:hypothetical protein [Actinoalloteichus hoggarensis]MBB5919515.1 hypothetical protein [Actinoalloteichus hoggarensis]